ncbi:BatD family protein [Salinibacter sp. 10B]|uniref:BatD family protein n=1 Tax=Salinibacter sp. 10B TaxID=1923971 RepID=UPI0015E2D9CA|nr:BatD family protein [Salinibacter sp. 10B]
MHSLRLLALLTGMGLLLVGGVRAQSGDEVEVTASAQPSEVGTAGTVVFKIQVKGAPLSAIETSSPPSTTNLVLQNPTPQTDPELSFDSGRLTRHVAIKWTYEPLQVGIGRIRPTTIRIRGTKYTTDEIRVRIVPQSQRPSRAPSASAPPAASSQRPSSQSNALGPRALFIRATASADTAYQNEQVTAEYRLFFRPGVRLRQSRMADAWDAPGFWREELDVASRPTPRTTDLYDQTYKAITLKRVALFPTQSGSLTIDPLRIETEARPRPQMGRRETVPRSRYEPVTLSSEELTVHVESLPPDSPPSFDGAVGRFSLDTQISNDSVEVGEAVDLTVRLQGSGNLATIAPPLVEPPSDFETYEPSVQTELDRSGGEVQGTKTFSYTLVPRSNGGYTLPPVTFTYFDPEAEQYRTLQSAPITLHATGDVPPQAVGRTGEGLPIGDIAGPIENAQWVRAHQAPLYAQPWAYAAVFVPILLAAGGAVYRRYTAGPTAPNAPPPDALDTAQRHLQDAHTHLRGGDADAFYGTVEHAVLSVLDAHLDLPQPPAGLTQQALDQHLVHHDVPPSDRKAVQELLDTCNEAQFSPTDPSYDAMEATLDHAQRLLLRLDDSLPTVKSR